MIRILSLNIFYYNNNLESIIFQRKFNYFVNRKTLRDFSNIIGHCISLFLIKYDRNISSSESKAERVLARTIRIALLLARSIILHHRATLRPLLRYLLIGIRTALRALLHGPPLRAQIQLALVSRINHALGRIQKVIQ